ncbi:MAG: DNA repair protein RecO [Rhizobiaceae bacterium]|nr:DNA repair protein RecO [Rhizobiaceae bacterium]
MEWRDEGIVLGTRRHGENNAVLEVMTATHGRHLGMVRGGRSRRQQPVLQAGNRVELLWRARLDEHLGTFQVEPLQHNAARLFESAAAVHGLQVLAAHLRLLPERDPHAGLYGAMAVILDHLDQPAVAGELLVRFELMVLDELGFGLDLSRCAATGRPDDLVFVSPRSGRAVSREAGEPWRDRMLALPAFLGPGSRVGAQMQDLDAAFRMTGFFLTRHVYEPRGIGEPEARSGFLTALRKHYAATVAEPAG